MKRAAPAVLALCLSALWPATALAQETEPADPAAPDVPPPAEALAPPPPTLDDLVDMLDDPARVPDNPALDILDAGSLDAVKPGTAKDVATELRALYTGGKLVPQVAVELSPYALAFGNRTTYDDYRRRWWVPLVHRLSVSVATTASPELDSEATIGALGLRVRIFDRSDWRLDRRAVECAMAAAKLAKPPAQPGTAVVVPVEDEASKQEAKAVQACFDQAKRRRGSWNAEQLAIGGAISSAFPGGKLAADIRDLTAWIGWGHRLGVGSHLVVAGKYLFADTRRAGEVRTPARHLGAITVEIERRSDRFGLVGSAGLGLRWTDEPGAAAWSRATVGQLGGEVAIRATSATWVALRLAAFLSKDTDGSFVSLANFKWNFDVRPGPAKTKK